MPGWRLRRYAALLAVLGACVAPAAGAAVLGDAAHTAEPTVAVPAGPVAAPAADATPEAQAALEEQVRSEDVKALLQTDYASRGPSWIENAGVVNPADVQRTGGENEQLDKLLHEIEAAARAPAPNRPARPGAAHGDGATPLDDNLLVHLPREVVRWVKAHRDEVVWGGIAALLVAWAAGALAPAAHEQWQRRRTHETADRRRRRHRRPSATRGRRHSE